MKLGANQALEVRLRWTAGDELRVGRLAWRDRRAWLELDEAFLAAGMPLSPFHLPFRPGLIPAPLDPFEGLFGVFDDSLPDGWGRLLQDRRATASGLSPAILTPLDRLAWVGDTGIGALAYRPELIGTGEQDHALDLDRLAQESSEVLAGAADEVLAELQRLGGSPHGARPKVLVSLRPGDNHVVSTATEDGHTPVLVKFLAPHDALDAGPVEYAYHRLARDSGLQVPDAWLLPSRSSGGWFAVARFDLLPGHRWHVHTLCGLLHADHRLPSLDYVGALAAVHRLTGDQQQLEQMFRRMVFNVLAHNRDDHTKQVSLRMDRGGEWTLAPAYDLTFAEGPGGEHSMAIAGAGRPGREDMLNVARQAGVTSGTANAIIDDVAEVISSSWSRYAAEAGVSERMMREIGARLRGVRPARV
jgi:serine/threonine-protein kinase HipA